MPRWDEIYAAQGSAQSKLRDRQTISVVDIISEGPIYGLVDGASSVYLNDDRAVPLSESGNFYSQSAVSIALVNGSATATISGGGTAPIIESENGDKYLIVRKGFGQAYVTASNGSAGTTDYNITATLTVVDNASFFTSAMVSTPVDIDTHVPARLGIITGGGVGDGMYGEGFITKRTSNSVAEYVPGTGGAAGIWIPDGSYSLEMDRIVKIASVSGNTITLAAVWPGTTGGYKFDVTGAVVTNLDVITQTKTMNYQGVTTQFRVGTLAQTPFTGKGGDGSTSITSTPSAGGTLEQSNNDGGSQAPKELIGSSASGFNLTASQLQEVDEARVTFAYASGHYAVSGKGNDKTTFTRYKTEIAIKKPGESSFEAYQVLKHPLVHSGIYKNAVTFVETIDLTAFRPFADFQVRVSRISAHDGPAYKTLTETFHDWQMQAGSSITNTTCVIKDILTHPFTSLAKVTFDTKAFQQIPVRSYHARGLKVSVPSNYVTREQSSDGIANYMRNTTSGLVSSTYQDWDGSFATDKTYTNNPAWVFYDILTNNRYGLGDFLKATDIDKYALYRIARYCDVLVDDGKEGLEPRFTCNLYFTKAADAYKVLKDIATVFRSMLYYIDGKILPVIDAPSGPVYNFTKGNVLDGKFSYEGTGSKTRINQCIVTWIDPDANYKASPLIVEDRLNIAKTGRLISQSAMAMGATSEGQALRYGRWKLWTAANQREIINFSTALNATFLLPGDIINVQDSDRYAVRISGRISNSGTNRSTTSIPLDSTTTLLADNDYELSVVFIEPGAFATEYVSMADNAGTPVTTTYNKGDLIRKAWIDDNGNGTYTYQNIDTEEKAINAKSTAAGTDALVLMWASTTRVETKEVGTSAGNVDTLTVKTSGNNAQGNLNTAFSAIPAAESIWVLTQKINTIDVLGSAKQYKILGMSQNSKSEFGITAVEHYDDKFAAVDEDFTTFIADSVYPAIRHNDVVPPVLDVFGESMMNPNLIGEELTIQWTPPAAVGASTDSETLGQVTAQGVYEHLSGYELSHTFPDIESPVLIDNAAQTSWKIEGIQDGTYEIAVRAVNVLQNVSKPTLATVTVTDRYRENIPRFPLGVPYGGTTSVAFAVKANNVFSFQNHLYSVKSPSGSSTRITNTNSTSSAWQQSCATLPNITWSESDRNAGGEFITEHAYILIDASDSTDRLKLIKYHKPSHTHPFWYDTGTGNSAKYGSALSGTFTKAVGSSKVTGSGTSFLSQLKDGDILKLGSTEGYKIAAVVSDTVLYVTNSFSSFSGVQGFIPNIRIDYANDVIIARLYKTSSALILAEVYTKIDAVLKKAAAMIEEDGIEKEQIAADAVGTTEIDTSSATGGTFGAAVAALNSASFTSIDTAVLNADSVIAREVQVFPSGGTAPTISGTTLAGAGIDLKQDGDMYVGNAAANKYMFWDQSAGTMTFRGTLNIDDIVGSSATFGTLMAEVATIGTLNTEMLDSDAIVTRDIRVGPSVETNAGSFVTGTEYYITVLGNTTQAQWNSVANTSGVVYNLGSIFTAGGAGTGTGKARNRTTVAKIAGATLTGTGAHLNAAGDFYVGNASTNKYMFWDQSAGTMQIRGALNADDINAGNITASNINVTNLAALSANLGNVTAGTLKGGTIPEASSAPTSTESGTFFDLTGGRMVLGNASKYIWWNGTNLEINGVTISDATLSGSTGFATETFVTAAINNLVDNAPAALNTLNEIAAALDDDASFHSSVTTSLSNKVGTTSAQALTTAANAMTISGSTISLVRANGDTDTVAVPNNNTEYTAGSGLALSGTTFSNSAPDRTVALTAGTNISVSGTYPNFTITSNASNTQRTDEEIRDVAASIITAGSNINVVKNDGANTVTISSSFTNTQRTDEEIRDVAASIITAGTNVSVVKNDAANTVTISSTDNNTEYTAGSGLSLSGTAFSNSAPDRTVTLTGAGTTTVSGSYPDFTITSNANSGNASQLGGQSASHYLNVNTTFGGDVSGKYNAIVIADDSHNHIISNVDGLQTALNGKVDDGQVLTNVPTGALFTDTNHFLNSISKSGNTLTFSVSGATNQSFAFGSNAFTSHSAPHYTSAIVSSDVTGALGFTPGTSSLALGTSSSTALAGNTSIPQGDITAITVSAPITGGGTTGSVGIAITQSSGSANGYLSSTDWTTFNNKSTFNGAYGSLSGRPTIPSGNQIIDWTTDQGATNINAGNYLNTNTTNFGIRANADGINNISAGETVTFRQFGAATVTRSGNNIDISSLNEDRYVNSASFNSSNGVLTLTRAGSDTVAVTVDLDGRYATVNDTGTPAILSNGSSPSLNSGISGAEVRNAIGAGTSNLAIGTTSTTALAGNTNLTSGVQTVTVGSNVGGIIVSGGSTATATLSVHATLEGIADNVPIAKLDVDFLNVDTVVANKITANTINANHLAVSNNVADATSQGIYFDANGVITIRDSSGTIRVKIGDLS